VNYLNSAEDKIERGLNAERLQQALGGLILMKRLSQERELKEN
jgi:hypothetical protein